MRALLDANTFISYLLRSSDNGAVGRCVAAGILQNYTLLIAQPILDEVMQRVATKPYLARKIDLIDVNELMSVLLSCAEVVPTIMGTIPEVGRDAKDDYTSSRMHW